MKNLTKKRTLFYGLFLLMSFHVLRAAKSVSQPDLQPQKDHTLELTRAKRKILIHGYCRAYKIPTDVFPLIIYSVHDNPLKYKNQPLPLDLSEQDLSGYDFTGCHFTHTNLTDSKLANVILTSTTCDYQKAFLDNSKKNKLTGGDWYRNNLPLDLKSISQVYTKLNNNTHKAKLLQVASALSFLPFYDDNEFYIKVAYWSCALLQLKQLLDNPYGKQLVCSLQKGLEYDANNYCWTTNYPQNKTTIHAETRHTNFDTYLKEFINGLTKYECKSYSINGFNWYKKHITKNIEGLAATYPNIKEATLQQEACTIAHALSKSYQIQKKSFLFHYLVYQHRLTWVKKSVRIGMKNKVHYSLGLFLPMPGGWSRYEK